MVKTYGLTHIALSVADKERSLKFYSEVIGAKEYFRDETSVQFKTPGANDVIALVEDKENAGKQGGVQHFGFRLTAPDDINDAVENIKKAGGKILSTGEFSPGFPFVFALDPDGYEIEIWYE